MVARRIAVVVLVAAVAVAAVAVAELVVAELAVDCYLEAQTPYPLRHPQPPTF